MENDGEILRRFLSKTEADFLMTIAQERGSLVRLVPEQRSDLELIVNMLEKINLYEKKESATKKGKTYYSTDSFNSHVAYGVDIMFRCEPLVKFLESLEEEEEDPLMQTFIESMVQLEKIMTERLSISAVEEVKRDDDLKTAYRLSMMLSSNIQELEDLLEKQRQELGREQDRKEGILIDLEEKIEKLREKCQNDINKIIYESEVSMMRDYNKSIERQDELAKDATLATRAYESLLEDHLEKEKVMRAKRLKVETQLASWVTKYDTDIGEKQAEYDELEKEYNEEKEQMDLLQEEFDIQEEEYLTLMKEKEDEEQRIFEEKAWIFLQNRSARRIQRAWKAYKARKLARKKARKGKKKGSAGSKKGKGKKKSPKAKKVKVGPSEEPIDPNLVLQGKFSEAVLGEIKSKEGFEKKDLVVNLIDD